MWSATNGERLNHGLAAADIHRLSGDAARGIRGDIANKLGDFIGVEEAF